MNKSEIISYLTQYMRNLDNFDHFNGCVLAAYQGEVLLSKGYGTANRTFEVPNSPSTRYPIGSLTKSFTAAAILRLEEQGLLNMEDSVEWHLPGCSSLINVTLHHLLSNTSGIPDFAAQPDYWEKHMRLPATVSQLIERIVNQPLHFEPGSQYSYSNSNYIILTAIIETVSGQSYSSFIQKEWLKPLGLHDSGVLDGRTIVKNLATGYSIDKMIIYSEYIDMSFPLGAYGMYSTVKDLFTWTEALFSGRMLTERSLKKMCTPYKGKYGYGWGFDKLSEREVVCHFGDVNGFCSEMLRSLDGDVTVIVLSNFNITPVTRINRDLAAILCNERVDTTPWIMEEPLYASLPFDFQGTYYSEDGEALITLYREGSTYFMTLPKRYGVVYTLPVKQISSSSSSVLMISSNTPESIQIIKEDNKLFIHHHDSDGTIKTLTRAEECKKKQP
ncbi:serine hydrolase domain-containing protein [Fictibacillus sp. S7]|uniref:serine hydrolase domain-containing protein n=1 Tax=Fictibacillus sp. S7 TaxID=2212476 RepID=UPI0010120E89|nr:serine hydrolase domain-containing protein [Fictibacillus sp. S7]RXZ02262.1 penicillin-binding protein [Fictibacillus sp. S7]